MCYLIWHGETQETTQVYPFVGWIDARPLVALPDDYYTSRLSYQVGMLNYATVFHTTATHD